MKEHIQSDFVNALRDIALKYHAHGSLRDKLSECVIKYLLQDEQYHHDQVKEIP